MEQEEEKKSNETTKFNPMHGQYGNCSWDPPKTVFASKDPARPGYQSLDQSEYKEIPSVLKEKISLLASLIKRSKQFVVYTGAGISISAGLGDYASKAGQSASGKQKIESINRLKAVPTYSHYALTALYKKGYLKHWVQQNHDGLAQKSGYPQKSINEIHGSWFDMKNPVVVMDGTLKQTNFKSLQEWTEKTDLVLALGSSLCGMTSDMIAATVAQKAMKGDQASLGLVIINLQKTQYDTICQLRIFGLLDKIMSKLMKEMKIKVDTKELYTNPRAW